MSKIEIPVEKVYGDVIKALLSKEGELQYIHNDIVYQSRRWWGKWLYKDLTDNEIVNRSLDYRIQRAEIELDISKLKALRLMCVHGVVQQTAISLSREDYQLIYDGYL